MLQADSVLNFMFTKFATLKVKIATRRHIMLLTLFKFPRVVLSIKNNFLKRVFLTVDLLEGDDE